MSSARFHQTQCSDNFFHGLESMPGCGCKVALTALDVIDVDWLVLHKATSRWVKHDIDRAVQVANDLTLFNFAFASHSFPCGDASDGKSSARPACETMLDSEGEGIFHPV